MKAFFDILQRLSDVTAKDITIMALMMITTELTQ